MIRHRRYAIMHFAKPDPQTNSEEAKGMDPSTGSGASGVGSFGHDRATRREEKR
jgi:hypothetical protein